MSSSSTSEALVRFSSTPSDRRQIPGMSMPNSEGQTLLFDDWTAHCDARESAAPSRRGGSSSKLPYWPAPEPGPNLPAEVP